MTDKKENNEPGICMEESLHALGCVVIQLQRSSHKVEELQEKCASLDDIAKNQAAIIDDLASKLGKSDILCAELEKALNDTVAELNEIKRCKPASDLEKELEYTKREVERLTRCLEVNDSSYGHRIEELNRQLSAKFSECEELRKRSHDFYDDVVKLNNELRKRPHDLADYLKKDESEDGKNG